MNRVGECWIRARWDGNGNESWLVLRSIPFFENDVPCKWNILRVLNDGRMSVEEVWERDLVEMPWLKRVL